MKPMNYILIAGILGSLACSADSEQTVEATNPTLRESVTGKPELSTLSALLSETQLDAALDGDTELTVFAPNDAAFEAIASAVPTSADLRANILLHHVVAGRLAAADLETGRTYETLAGTNVIFEDAPDLAIGGARLSTDLDIVAANGVLHITDQVLVPPSIGDAVNRNPDLSTLGAAIGAASSAIRTALNGGPITVFAPTNAAFDAIEPDDLSRLLDDISRLDAVLSYHVVSGQVLAAEIADGQMIETLNGAQLRAKVDAGNVFLLDGNGSRIRVTATDIRLLNGTVHLVEEVLLPEALPPNSIVDVAVGNGMFNTLVDAAVRAGLDSTLADGGPFTVFAPTDAAFNELGVDLEVISDSVIGNILLHHVLPGIEGSAAVTTAESYTTLAKTSITVDTAVSPPTIGGAALSSTLDVEADNGIIHVIDAVMIPPTVATIGANTAELSTLMSAISEASPGVQEALAPSVLTGRSPITVFAPTNAAFDQVPAQDLADILADQAKLDDLLAHHVVSNQALSVDLENGQSITTLNGGISVVVSGENIQLTDGQGNVANVVTSLTDIRGLDGVVHVIDRVLIPNGI